MILRRFATAVRQQDWFVAIVEVLIVVVGILGSMAGIESLDGGRYFSGFAGR